MSVVSVVSLSILYLIDESVCCVVNIPGAVYFTMSLEDNHLVTTPCLFDDRDPQIYEFHLKFAVNVCS